jgi:hypothetical protein
VELVDQLATPGPARAMTIDRRSILRLVAAIVAVATSALAYYTSTGLGAFWPGAWLAPIPILMLAFQTSKTTAALAALAAYVCGGMNLPYTDWGVSRSEVVLTLLPNLHAVGPLFSQLPNPKLVKVERGPREVES